MTWRACVYCTHMTCGDVNYCDVHKHTYADSTIRGGNRCKDYEFNEINAENPDHIYRPHALNCPDPRQARIEVVNE